MPRPHRLPTVALDLVEDYLSELTQAGFRAVGSAEDGARAFCARFGSPEGWTAAPLAAQLAADERVRRFVAWLALTARMPVSADYLVGRRPRLGPIMAAYHPAVSAVFDECAASLGFVPKSSERQWAALAQVCALHAVTPTRSPMRCSTRPTPRSTPPPTGSVSRRTRTGMRSCSGCRPRCSTPGSATNHPARAPTAPVPEPTAGNTCPPFSPRP
jgi:hypothetical protein